MKPLIQREYSLVLLTQFPEKRVGVFNEDSQPVASWTPRKGLHSIQDMQLLDVEVERLSNAALQVWNENREPSRFIHYFPPSPGPSEDQQLAGYTDCGWYFTEESFAHVQGPFESPAIARVKLEEYVEQLQPNPDQPQPGDGGEMGGEYDNDPTTSKVLIQGSSCSCGQDLPWHLLTLGPLKHQCSCGRNYVSDGTTTRIV